MSNDVAEIEEFGKRWVKAELDGDTGAMDSLAHNDFLLVGPLGFILDKAPVAGALQQRRIRHLSARLA